MPIPLPNLDDRRFADLVEEGKRLIPGLAPSWTDHNPSDPGITLIELFAFIAEMLIYRANRVSEANRWAFVKLLRGPAWPGAGYIVGPIDDEIARAILDLRDEQRAVTPDDFERLAKAVEGVARAHCLPRRNLESDAPKSTDAPAHVSVVIVPKNASDGLATNVREVLKPRCLLTTRLHVTLPRYLKVRVNIVAHVFADQNEATIRTEISERISTYYHRLTGGSDGQGWPFGQAVYVCDLYAFLDGVEGVDYVTANGRQPALFAVGREITESGQFIGLRLEADELVELVPFKFDQPDANVDSVIVVIRQTTLIPEE